MGDKIISIEQFAEVELRVALIEAAEPLPKSKKLIKLQIFLGEQLGRRQILAGILPWTTPESLVGRKIIVVANLQPATLMGEESNGMLLACQNEDSSKVMVIEAPAEAEPGFLIR